MLLAFFFTQKSLNGTTLVQQMPQMKNLVGSDIEVPKIGIKIKKHNFITASMHNN